MSWEDILKDKTFPLPGKESHIDRLLKIYKIQIELLKQAESEFQQLKLFMNRYPDETLDKWDEMSGLIADVEGMGSYWQKAHEGLKTQLGRM